MNAKHDMAQVNGASTRRPGPARRRLAGAASPARVHGAKPRAPLLKHVDRDDPKTWPQSLRVGRWPYEPRDHLQGHLLLAFHCTRLLDHEVADIRRGGLQPLTEALLSKRAHGAYAAGKLSSAERDAILGGHVFATDDAEYRAGQVCFVSSRRQFGPACDPLLSTWGGEGIYKSRGLSDALRARLAHLGRPSIVEALLDFAVPGEHRFDGDVFYRAAVPASRIVDIWQPGHPKYDAQPALPRG